MIFTTSCNGLEYDNHYSKCCPHLSIILFSLFSPSSLFVKLMTQSFISILEFLFYSSFFLFYLHLPSPDASQGPSPPFFLLLLSRLHHRTHRIFCPLLLCRFKPEFGLRNAETAELRKYPLRLTTPPGTHPHRPREIPVQKPARQKRNKTKNEDLSEVSVFSVDPTAGTVNKPTE